MTSRTARHGLGAVCQPGNRGCVPGPLKCVWTKVRVVRVCAWMWPGVERVGVEARALQLRPWRGCAAMSQGPCTGCNNTLALVPVAWLRRAWCASVWCASVAQHTLNATRLSFRRWRRYACAVSRPCLPCAAPCAAECVLYRLYRMRLTRSALLCAGRCALCVVRCALCAVRCALCVVRCCALLCAVLCAAFGTRCALRCAAFALHHVRCAMCAVHVRCVACAWNTRCHVCCAAWRVPRDARRAVCAGWATCSGSPRVCLCQRVMEGYVVAACCVWGWAPQHRACVTCCRALAALRRFRLTLCHPVFFPPVPCELAGPSCPNLCTLALCLFVCGLNGRSCPVQLPSISRISPISAPSRHPPLQLGLI